MPHASTLQRDETLRWLNRLVIAALAAGSARAFRTGHELEGSLAGRATYALGAVPVCAERALHVWQPLDASLQLDIRAELCRQLAGRGYSATTAGKASLLLSCSAASRHCPATSGDWALRDNGRAVVAAPVTLVVQLRDARSGVVLWRGWGQGVLSGCLERDAQIVAAVRRILAALPAART